MEKGRHFQKHLADDWINHPSAIYQGLTSTNQVNEPHDAAGAKNENP